MNLKLILLCLFYLIHPVIKGESIVPCTSVTPDSIIPVQNVYGPVDTFKLPVYTTHRLSTAPPVIDGKLDDECWKTGTWAGDFIQWMPNEGAKPTYPTEFNIQYDNKFLYIAIRAYDREPEKIIRLSGVRDEHMGDMVGVAFDSNHDRRTGYEFSVSSWGQKLDLVIYNPTNFDMNWDAVWKVKTGVEDSAWVAEYQIPLSQLRYSNKKEQVWGLHAWRGISRIAEYSNWEPQFKNSPGLLYNFGELRGIDDLKRSRRIEIMPFVFGKLNTNAFPDGKSFH